MLLLIACSCKVEGSSYMVTERDEKGIKRGKDRRVREEGSNSSAAAVAVLDHQTFE